MAEKTVEPTQIDPVEMTVTFEPCCWVGGDYADVVPTTGDQRFDRAGEVLTSGRRKKVAT